ncbi:Bifunctional protein FolD protein [Streptomyces sp. SudanB66_2053]
MRLLEAYDVDLAGKHAVVVGRSAILGKPAGMLLLARNATVTSCHSRTADLSAAVREADVVVAVVGRSRLIRGEDIKPGAVVIDAGYNPGTSATWTLIPPAPAPVRSLRCLAASGR